MPARRGMAGALLPILLLLGGCMGNELLETSVNAASAPREQALALAEAQPSSPDSALAPAPRRNEARPRTPPAPATQKPAEEEFLASLKRKINAAFEPDRPNPAQRQLLGDTLARKVLDTVRLSSDATLQRRVEGIVKRLAVPARAESAFPSRWQVRIIDSDRADAFTSGGGHLFITRGMIDLLGSDERIATVLAHEMAHNLMAHVWDAKEKKDLARRAHAFSRDVLARQMRMAWLGKSVSFLVNASLNTYSRQQEYDADALGLHLLVQAGWRPQAALETFDFLRRHFREKSGVKNFFHSRHPVYDRRRWYLANRIKAHYRHQAGLPPVRRANWNSAK